MNNILVINAGSSSVKYQLINMDTESVLSKGNCEKIGLPTSFIEHKYGDKKVVITEVFENHVQAIKMILDLLVSAKLCASKGEGRRLVTQGGVSVNDVKVTDPTTKIKASDYEEGYAIVKKGKKVFTKLVF